ncbi:MAG: hypothetical protein ACF8PN_13790 [Phycisphaerales bacterium]
MRTLWTALSILSIAHLLALAGFAGFLAGTGRLSRDRIDATRRLYQLTVADEQANKEAAESEAASAAEAAMYEASMNTPNFGAESRSARVQTVDQVLLDRQRRADMELKSLERYLNQRIAELEQSKIDLQNEREAFEAERDRIRQLESDTQFKRTVEIFKGLGPEGQKTVIDEYLADGRETLVVDLIDALDKRTAQNLLKQFADPDGGPVAARLLYLLSERGVSTPTSPESDNEPTGDDP